MQYPVDILRRVQKPLRYVGGEYNALRKDPASVHTTVALVFPDTYEMGMSHLGSRILYQVLNDLEGVAAERAYCPWPDMENELRQAELPLLTLENGLPLRDCQIIGMSLLYEMTFTNVLTVLDLGGIPLRTLDRAPGDPLVVAGGPAASNPEPVADFLDLVVLGEGEEAFPEILRMEHETRSQRAQASSRAEALRPFASIPGVYVPCLYPIKEENGRVVVDIEAARTQGLPVPVRRRLLKDLESHPLPRRVLVPGTEIIHDRIAAEISRGCNQGCRFCHASVFYRPQRERDAAGLVDWILSSAAQTGYEEVSLASLSSGDFGGIEDLAEVLTERLRESHVSLSFPSLRVSRLSDRLAKTVAEIRKTGFTVAPEAGTQRLRDAINKGLTEEQILEGILAAYRAGWDVIKLYFMIGLPFETEEDVLGIAELVRRILEAVRNEPDAPARRRRFQVTVSASCFVPKPHTPFQWAAMAPADELARKAGLLRGLLKDRAVTFKWHDPKTSRLEALVSRGDRALSRILEEVWKQGARMDGWNELFRPDLWGRALEEGLRDPVALMGGMDPETLLPWGHLDLGVSPDFLREEWRRASAAVTTPACGIVEAEDGSSRPVCQACGAGCDLTGLAARRTANLKALESLRTDLPAQDKASRETEYQPFRLKFSKEGTAAWLSHLDLIRTLQRILIRAGLPIKYTEGFHPHPQVGFSPALSVGIASLSEFADFSLAGRPDSIPAWLEALQAVTHPGIRILDLAPLPPQAPSITEWARKATYRIDLPLPALVSRPEMEGGDPSEVMHGLIAALLSRTALPVLRKKKGQPAKERDLRPLILGADMVQEQDHAALLLQCAITPQGTIRPEEWLELCLPGWSGPWTCTRLALEP